MIDNVIDINLHLFQSLLGRVSNTLKDMLSPSWLVISKKSSPSQDSQHSETQREQYDQRPTQVSPITTLYIRLLYAFVLLTDFTIEMNRANSVQYLGPLSRKTDFEKAL